jgi:hypothetical protein
MKKTLLFALVPFLSGCGLVFVHGPPSGWQAIQDVDALETMALTQPCTTGKSVLFLDGAAAAFLGILGGFVIEDNYQTTSTFGKVDLVLGAASLGIGGLYAFSALRANGRVNDCRALNARLSEPRRGSLSSVVSFSGPPPNAQQSEEFQPRNVISANPIGLLVDLFNAEYERVISPTSTIGFGGSTNEDAIYQDPPVIGTDEYGFPIYDYDSEPRYETHQYVNFDVFWRFYPGSNRTRTYNAPVGWAFGAKMGITAVDGGTYFGYGVDLNRSFVLGPDDNFYVGLGFGLKRLLGAPQDEAGEPILGLSLIPTIRIVNVGFIF